MTRRTSKAGIELIKKFEGDRLESYRCPAGVWTVSAGVTGSHVKPGMKITQEESDALFAEALKKFEAGVTAAVKVPLTQPQFDAVISLAYNIGLPAFRASTLLKMLNAREYGKASTEFGRWIHAGGQVLPGLIRRRSAERDLFLQR
jgi:lysozyme